MMLAEPRIPYIWVAFGRRTLRDFPKATPCCVYCGCHVDRQDYCRKCLYFSCQDCNPIGYRDRCEDCREGGY